MKKAILHCWLCWHVCKTSLRCTMVFHYSDVIMASQITSLTIVYSAAYSGANQRKHQISASLAFVRGIHRSLVNSLHKWPVTRKMFPFDDVIMTFVINGTSNNPVKQMVFSMSRLRYAPNLESLVDFVESRILWTSEFVYDDLKRFESPTWTHRGFSCCNNTVKNIQGCYCVNISVRSSDYPLRPQKYPLRSTHSLGW